MQTKKMRITDFFRRQDKDGDGFLSRDEFVSGMLQSGKIITFKSWLPYLALLLHPKTNIRVATVREKVLENEKISRSGKSQGIIFSVREI